MITRRAPFHVPALVKFSGAAARADAWGRLLELTAGGAVLVTAAPLARGERLGLVFELAGERLGCLARVERWDHDADGHVRAELAWTDMAERKKLARVLTDVLARS